METPDEADPSSSVGLDPQPFVDKKGMDAKERHKHWKNIGYGLVSFVKSSKLKSYNSDLFR